MKLQSVWVSENILSMDLTDPLESVDIPFEAICSMMELGGYKDPAGAIEAILVSRELPPAKPDPVTGETIWKPVHSLLKYREQQREIRASEYIDNGPQGDPRSLTLSSTAAAFDAVHVPIDGGNCMFDRARTDVLQQVGLPPAETRCGATTRHVATVSPMNHSDQLILDVTEALLPHMKTLDWVRRQYLHEIGGLPTNPLQHFEDEVMPDYLKPTEEQKMTPLQRAMKKYGGDS